MRREQDYEAKGELAKIIREEIKRKPTKEEMAALQKALRNRIPRRKDRDS